MTRPNDLAVLYDADCGVCSQTARALARADSNGVLNLVTLQKANLPDQPPLKHLLATLHVRDADGRWFTGGAATVEIARRIPMLRPLGWYARLPLAMPLMDLGYRLVAHNRHVISKWLGLKACKVPSRRAA